jgi:cytidyltransferase-like protein
MNETLIFGGSFDPVHNGHVAMLEAAITQLQPARTLVIPVGNAWQKARMPYAPSRHRIAMLKLALPNITVDDRASAITVPRAALIQDTGGDAVLVVTDGLAKTRAVKVIEWPAARLIVTDGLNAGDVVIADATGLTDGQAVKVAP